MLNQLPPARSRLKPSSAIPRTSLRAAAQIAVALFSILTVQIASSEEPPRDVVTIGLPLGRLIFTQIPVDAANEAVRTSVATIAPVDLPDGSRIVSFDAFSPDKGVTNLTPNFAAAGRPDVSFDGDRMLFVAKRDSKDPCDVWEMKLDGGDARRITSGVGNCNSAIYLSRIYTLDAEKPVDQIAFGSDAGDAGPSLHTCRLDGSRVRRITFNPYGVSDPYQLSDGRLLYSSRQHSGPSDGAGSALFTVNTDGTDVFVFAAAHERPAVRGMPCETTDGRVIFVESAPGDPMQGGALRAVSRTRSLHSRTTIAEDHEGLYHSPSQLSEANLLVSYRDRNGGSYSVHVLDLKSGTRTSTVYDAPQWHELDAVAVRPRSMPDGRSSVVDDRVDTGLLFCLDSTLSDAAHQQGRERAIAQLQVFRALPRGGRDSEADRADVFKQELLGVVPVESDGSFFLRVPARAPLRLQTLDGSGRVVQSMHNWFWVMPNESRGCIGCHEDRELTPPNRHVLALRKSPVAVGVADIPDRKSKGSGMDRKSMKGSPD